MFQHLPQRSPASRRDKLHLSFGHHLLPKRGGRRLADVAYSKLDRPLNIKGSVHQAFAGKCKPGVEAESQWVPGCKKALASG